MGVVALAALATACGGGGGATLDRKATPAPSTTPATLPPFVTLIARVRVPNVGVYDSPTSPQPSRTFANPWLLNNDAKLPVELVFLVEQRQGPWLQVLLPIRPNGTTGWVHSQDVSVQQNEFRITVELRAHRLVV